MPIAMAARPQQPPRKRTSRLPQAQQLWVWCCVLWAGAGGAGGARPPPVLVTRCCPEGEALAPAAGAHLCRPAGNDTAAPAPAWPPLVYSLARRQYLPRGTLPPHWRVQPSPATWQCAPALHLPPAHYRLLSNGSLWDARTSLHVGPASYCLDASGALVCGVPLEAAVGAPLRRCCLEGGALERERLVCVRGASEGGAGARLAERLGAAGARIESAWPECAGESRAVLAALAGARLLADGSLQVGAATLPPHRYCAEWWAGADEGAVVGCVVKGAGGGRGAHHAAYGALAALGALGVAGALALQLWRGAPPHALHYRCQARYLAALLAGDALLAAAHLAPPAAPAPLCRAIAVAMHFLFLAAFFWLNTMCFNIWWTFRDFRAASVEKRWEARRLRVYVAWAWGCPLLLAGAALVADTLDAGDSGATRLAPRFARTVCWFDEAAPAAAALYFYGPVGVLLAVNCALFACTVRALACGLWREERGGGAGGAGGTATQERARLAAVCGKLVVVMGVPWALEVVSWACGGPAYLWYLTDAVNALQGVCVLALTWPLAGTRRRALAACARRPHVHTQADTLTNTAPPATPAASAASAAPAAPTAPVPLAPLSPE